MTQFSLRRLFEKCGGSMRMGRPEIRGPATASASVFGRALPRCFYAVSFDVRENFRSMGESEFAKRRHKKEEGRGHGEESCFRANNIL